VAPLGGSTGRTWFASRVDDAAVVRLDASGRVLERVARLGIGPAVLASGRIGGRAYVIQQYVNAPSPGRPWLADHVEIVGRLFRAFAEDRALARLAKPLAAEKFAADLVETATTAGLDPARLGLVQALATEAPWIDPGDVVASHGDPNDSNFLVADRLLLVDWDDLRVADPLRDLGQFAWWYLPEPSWPSFLEIARLPWNEATRRRFYWWVAAESLDVGLRLLPHDGAAAAHFFLDFERASRREPNARKKG
jgi:hypothetical protein